MTSFVFPGQGSQFLNMAKDFHDNFTVAKKIFEEIEDYTSINLRQIIFSENDDLLNQTQFTQISIFASSISIFNTLKEEKNINTSNINFMLGHSLGEFSALACSKILDLKQSSILLKKRGELMGNVVEKNIYGMVALIGCSISEIENIIKDNNIDLEIANDNSPIQVVLSGRVDEIIKQESTFKKCGVKKYVRLNVSSAFHSVYMKDAENEFSDFIDKSIFLDSHIKIISNSSSRASNKNIDIKNSLKKQMSSKVRWVESVKYLEASKEKNIVEIGPGKVLSGLIRRISSFFDIKTINKISDLDNF